MNSNIASTLFLVGKADFKAVSARNKPFANSLQGALEYKTPDVTNPQSLDELNSPIKKPKVDFCQALRKKTNSEDTQIKTDKEDSDTGAHTETDPSQLEIAQNTPIETLIIQMPKEDISLIQTESTDTTVEKTAQLQNIPPNSNTQDAELPENFEKPILTEFSSNLQADNTAQPETKGIDLSEALPDAPEYSESAFPPAENNEKANIINPAEPKTKDNQQTENNKNNTIVQQPQLDTTKTVDSPIAETPVLPKPAPIVDANQEEPQIEAQNPQKTAAEPKINTANVPISDNKETPPGILSLAASEMGGFKNNTSAEILTNKFNLAEAQFLANNSKQDNASALKEPNSDSSPFEQLLSANNAQTPALDNTATAAQFPKTNFNPLPDDIAQNMNRQIQESIQSSTRQGQDQVIIRLNPPELGKVVIKFHEQDNQIIGTLEASKPQTRYEIEQALPSILRNLQESGVQIRRIDVLSEQNNQQYSNKEQPLFDGWNGQNHSANYSQRGYQGDSAYNNDWIPDTDIYSGTSPAQDLFYAESGVNMLA